MELFSSHFTVKTHIKVKEKKELEKTQDWNTSLYNVKTFFFLV